MHECGGGVLSGPPLRHWEAALRAEGRRSRGGPFLATLGPVQARATSVGRQGPGRQGPDRGGAARPPLAPGRRGTVQGKSWRDAEATGRTLGETTELTDSKGTELTPETERGKAKASWRKMSMIRGWHTGPSLIWVVHCPLLPWTARLQRGVEGGRRQGRGKSRKQGREEKKKKKKN